MARLLIVGGSDAGISAGLRARQVDPQLQVRLLLADHFPNYSICGLPFYISGETPDWRALAHRQLDELERGGLHLLMETVADSFDANARLLRAHSPQSGEQQFQYDRLIIATGAEPIKPPIPGLELPGVHLLHTMEDSFAVRRALEAGARSALIVGGGYIGLEMADAFRHRGIEVTLAEMANQLMTSVDVELAQLLLAELQGHGVEVLLRTTLERIEQVDDRRQAVGSGSPAPRLRVCGPGLDRQVDLVLVVVGVQPNAGLAVATGVETGGRGAIRVNRRMETNLADVFAAGDCVETYHRLLARPVYIPLGTTAHKQGRVAGENAAGGLAEFQGSLGTQVVKVFDLAVARTGLSQREAAAAGFQAASTLTTEFDHKAYYPGAGRLRIKVTGDRQSGRLLGAQIVGPHNAQVAKRIDIFAAALYCDLRVDQLLDLDLSYTPPFAAPWDAVQVAAQEWLLS